MGNIFGDQNSERTIDKLEDLVWESSDPIKLQDIQHILTDNNINVQLVLNDIHTFILTKAKEHEVKSDAFLRNKSPDMHSHHKRMSCRYYDVASKLKQCYVFHSM
jgi:hypothetical protein